MVIAFCLVSACRVQSTNTPISETPVVGLTNISTLTPTQTPTQFPAVSEGTPLPMPVEKIEPENVDQLVLLGSLKIDGAYQVLFSPDGTLLAVDTELGIYIYDVHLMADKMFIENKSFASIAFYPDGSKLIAESSGTIKVWDVKDGLLVKTISGYTTGTNCFAISPDGQLLALGIGKSIVLIRYSDGSLVRVLTRHNADVNSVAFSPDGTMLASTGEDLSAIAWWLDTGRYWIIQRFPHGKLHEFRSVGFTPDGKNVVFLVDSVAVWTWVIMDDDLLPAFITPSTFIRSYAFSPDGKLLAAGAEDGKIFLLNTSDQSVLRQIVQKTNDVMDITFSPDGSLIALRTLEGLVQIWGIAP